MSAKIKAQRPVFSGFYDSLKNKLIGTLFCEASTRTKISFEVATLKLGGQMVGIDNPEISSLKKGENIADASRVLAGYDIDAIVMRHKLDGAAKLVAEFVDIPVFNGGDGSQEHPTQSMLDLFTIREYFGKIDGLNIGIFGHLNMGRTVPSLSYALANYKVDITYIAHPRAQVRNEVTEYLNGKEVVWDKVGLGELPEVLPKLDIIYVTRPQRERVEQNTQYDVDALGYKLDTADLQNAKPTLKVMHPLPRVDELAYGIDNNHGLYFTQSKNGQYVRMALLHLVVGKGN